MPFEFMMNALRLNEGVHAHIYPERTGLNLSDLDQVIGSLKTA